MLGHEHAVGQDGAHDEHAKERGARVKEATSRGPAGRHCRRVLALGLLPQGQCRRFSETGDTPGLCPVLADPSPRRLASVPSSPRAAGHLPCSIAPDRDQTLESAPLAGPLEGPSWREGGRTDP